MALSGCGRAEEYQGYVNNAQSAFSKNDFTGTIEWYNKAKGIDSLAMEDTEKYVKAQAILKSQEHFKNGKTALAEGSLKFAVEHLKQVIETDPSYNEAQPILADAKMKYAEQLFNEAKTLYAEGNYKEAYDSMLLSTSVADYKPAMELLPKYKEKYDTIIKAAPPKVTTSGAPKLDSPRDFEQLVVKNGAPVIVGASVEGNDGKAYTHSEAEFLGVWVSPEWHEFTETEQKYMIKLHLDVFNQWKGDNEGIVIFYDDFLGEQVGSGNKFGVEVLE